MKDNSDYAKAVNKGIKQKEFDDFERNLLGFLAIAGSIGAGLIFHSFWAGLIVFVIAIIFITKRYYKE
jgi:hypothetical protein